MFDQLSSARKKLDNLHEPEKDKEFGEAHPLYTIDQQTLAQMVGGVAVLLPVFAALASIAPDICRYQSVSHFYFAPWFGPVFVGSLTGIAVFMFAYRGENELENIYARWGALFALIVAWVPTTGSGCSERRFSSRLFADLQVSPPASQNAVEGFAPVYQISTPLDDSAFAVFGIAGWVHYFAAIGMFLFLIWYALVVFPRPIRNYNGQPPTEDDIRIKKTRNRVYAISGIVMIVSFAALTFHYFRGIPDIFGWGATFVFESTTLMAFGVSWLVKGRVRGLFMDSRDRAAREPRNSSAGKS